MDKLAKYLSIDESAELFGSLAEDLGACEVAVVRNIDFVYAPLQLYLLSPKVTYLLDRIAAFAVDMDGTSTTTEPLALHALEYMVRRFTGRMSKSEWPGLDEEKDYPFVIGNSNFRHTEFLVDRYRAWLDHDALCSSFIESLLWTLSNIDDKQRIKDIRQNAMNCGLGGLLGDPQFKFAIEHGSLTEDAAAEAAEPFIKRFGQDFKYDNRTELVSAALDIYYARYHSILQRVKRGEGRSLSRELLGESGRRLIEPMPGYAVFIALVKGWLGEEAGTLYDVLAYNLPQPLLGKEGRDPLIGGDFKSPPISGDLPPLSRGDRGGSLPPEDECRQRLSSLALRFKERPAKLALVTASIAYEAHTVVEEVFNVMIEEVANWPVSADVKHEITDKLTDYHNVYDGFVTASDSSEARLKPHPDLFSIALYQMSIPREDYGVCIGLEDTEPGIIALRAAGVGCAVALPNRDTSRQNYQAASHVVKGGLPDLILNHGLFLSED